MKGDANSSVTTINKSTGTNSENETRLHLEAMQISSEVDRQRSLGNTR